MSRYSQNIVNYNSKKVNKPTFAVPKIKKAVLLATGPNPVGIESGNSPTVNYKIKFPYGPNDLQFQQHNGVYNQMDRPFKKPLNVFSGGSLRVVTFEAIIVNRSNGGLTPGPLDDSGSTVQDIADMLETISQTGATCDFRYGVSKLPFKSFLTEFSYTVIRRAPDGQPLVINVSLQLTEKVEYNPDARLLPAIVRPPVNIAPVSSGGGGGGGGGDTLTDKLRAEFPQTSASYLANVARFANTKGITSATEAVKAYQQYQYWTNSASQYT